MQPRTLGGARVKRRVGVEGRKQRGHHRLQLHCCLHLRRRYLLCMTTLVMRAGRVGAGVPAGAGGGGGGGRGFRFPFFVECLVARSLKPPEAINTS